MIGAMAVMIVALVMLFPGHHFGGSHSHGSEPAQASQDHHHGGSHGSETAPQAPPAQGPDGANDEPRP